MINGLNCHDRDCMFVNMNKNTKKCVSGLTFFGCMVNNLPAALKFQIFQQKDIALIWKNNFLMFSLLSVLSVCSPYGKISAQNADYSSYFSSPLPVELTASGIFGEIRSNHFHSGVDYRVGGKEGMAVYAVADGVVARIKVSEVGFGRAIYIDHNNGLTSVYAHLQRYSNNISQQVIAEQYNRKSYSMDWFPANEKKFIRIKKGDIIGYAGNSGTSYGAHLHFEIRTTKTERILNPLNYGFDIQDDYDPVINLIKIYPQNSGSIVGTKNSAVKINVIKSSTGMYKLSGIDTLRMFGSFALGLQAQDYTYSAGDNCGWYGMEFSFDGEPFFRFVNDSFAFYESRNINACLDYAEQYNNGLKLMQSKKLPNNQFDGFKALKNKGIIAVTDNGIHKIVCRVWDVAGHESMLSIPVKCDASLVPDTATAEAVPADIVWSKDNVITKKNISITFPDGCLYESIKLQYKAGVKPAWAYSELHTVHRQDVALQKAITIRINAADVPAEMRPKACIVKVDSKGNRSYVGGKYADGNIEATSTSFGTFTIGSDNVAPVIELISNKSGNRISFTVTDNFSGIASYNGEIDGNWVLVESDPKNKLMFYQFDDYYIPGGEFQLTVTDNRGNKSVKKVSLP